MNAQLKDFLDKKWANTIPFRFIKDDPVCIPHLFSKKQDIEISGFFASIFAWGNRTIIIKKTKALLALMDNAPYEFVQQHSEIDFKPFLHFETQNF